MKDIKQALFETLKAAENMAQWSLDELVSTGKINDPSSYEFGKYESHLNAVNAMTHVLRESGVLDEYEAWKEQN